MLKSGFTLVKLIVAIVIVGILTTIGIPVYSGYVKGTETASDLSALDSVNTAVAAAYTASDTKPTATRVVYSTDTIDVKIGTNYTAMSWDAFSDFPL